MIYVRRTERLLDHSLSCRFLFFGNFALDFHHTLLVQLVELHANDVCQPAKDGHTEDNDFHDAQNRPGGVVAQLWHNRGVTDCRDGDGGDGCAKGCNNLLGEAVDSADHAGHEFAGAEQLVVDNVGPHHAFSNIQAHSGSGFAHHHSHVQVHDESAGADLCHAAGTEDQAGDRNERIDADADSGHGLGGFFHTPLGQIYAADKGKDKADQSGCVVDGVGGLVAANQNTIEQGGDDLLTIGIAGDLIGDAADHVAAQGLVALDHVKHIPNLDGLLLAAAIGHQLAQYLWSIDFTQANEGQCGETQSVATVPEAGLPQHSRINLVVVPGQNNQV